jgi:rhodanese-related sulfurtransferase
MNRANKAAAGSVWGKISTLVALAMLYFSPVNAQTWQSIRDAIRKKYPTVKQLSTDDLAHWLADTNRPAPLLIDARKKDEFTVSHLQNARHLDSINAVREEAKSNSRPLVVYCSVGYRSSAFAEKLQRAGFTNIFNLEGSIFAWANEGKPVHRGQQKLDPAKVHPYDKKWGGLLKSELHSLLNNGASGKRFD